MIAYKDCIQTLFGVHAQVSLLKISIDSMISNDPYKIFIDSYTISKDIYSV